MRLKEAEELGFTKGKQTGTVNAGDILNTDEWVKDQEANDTHIVERVEGGALIFEAVPPKAEEKKK